MATEAKNTNYWISSSALYIQLNAMGEPDYIQCSVVSGASILCYMQGIPGLEYDAGHNYQRWPLAAYPSVFPDSERKYIYVAIPRTSTADNNTAVVVYPSERIDLYGYSIANPDKLVGDERFYYIYLQGIISEVKTDADGKTRKRDWLQHVDCGKLNTDESLSSGIDGTWWKYNSVTDSISFLKTILSATFDTLTAKVAKITKLFLGGSELNGVADDLSLETDNTKVVTPLYLGQFGVKHFLAKDKDDVAHGVITFEKVQKFLAGLNVGDFNSENGGSWTPDAEGRSHLITDYLEVRMKAIFEELVVKKTSTIGGKEIISPAGGVVAHKVEEVTVTYNNVSQKAYRCYFLAEQEGDSVDNDFSVNDQVRSESFNVRKGTYHKVGNHFYWRLVIGRDEESVELEGKKYHYIDLSDTDCATASDVPAKGDVLSQCGNRTDVERQNCLIFSAVDTYSPSISLYHGINSYSFANREYVQYGVNKQTNKAFFNVYGDMYVGDRPTKENGYEGSSYIKYDSATKQVSVKGKISAKSTVDGKELSQYIKENSAKGLTEEQVNNLIKNSQVITDLQNQVDGAIETWFYEGVPTLNNAPASSWATDKEKDTHLGDLYYDNKTGKAYRFAKDGNTYKWTIITDTDIAKALSDASKAQETADGKMKVFSTQPTPPYQVGDIWVNATYPTDGSTYKNEVLRCQTLKAAGSPFAIADWIKASKYTDDTVANAAKAAAEKAQKAAEKAQGDISKLGTTVTTNKKAFDSYVTDGYLEPSEIAAMAQDSKRLEDAFAAAQKSYNEVKEAEVLTNTNELTDLNTAFATLTTAKTELVTYLSDISARYNAANTEKKATIVSAVGTKFTNFQSAYSAFYDKLGLANAYITSKIYGDLKQNITDLAGYKYIKDALGQTTDIDGGLVMTTLLALRDADGNVQSGINGAIDTNRGKKSIATWWGGQMVDKDYNSGSLTPATSLVRFDGSGYLANGAIWWDVDGKVHADPTSFIISEKNLGAYLTFFEPTWKSGSAGTSVADLVSLKPNAPFTKLGVSGDATFEGAITFHGIKLTYDATNKAIKIDGNLYATGGITAYGASSGAGGGGLNASVISYARIIEGSYTDADLTSIPNAYAIKALSNRIDNISSELGGLSLDWANITGKPSTFTPSAHTHKWVDITDRITKVSQLTNDSGYTTNKGTVTSVKLTLPTGLSLGTTKEITTSGTFAISLTSGYSIPTTSKQGQWDSAYNWYKLMTTDEETADGVINKWNEVVDFLAGIAQTDSLDSILSGINKSITDETNRAKKAEGANATNIATNKANITTLQGYFTNGSAKSAIKLTNARKLWGNSFDGTADISGSIVVPSGKYITIGNIKLEYDATNKALKITNTSTNEVANLYTSGGVSAYGVGTTSSGSTGGGGLNGTVKSYNDAKSLTSESLSEVASAYSVAALYSSINDAIGRINTLEGGSATSIEVTGSGNAVTGVSKSGTKLTFTKGATFLTSHQDISGKSDKTHTHSVKINGVTKTIAATGGTAVDLGTYLTSHQSLAAYLKSADAEKTYSKLGHTHAFSEITGKPTTLAGYGVTDGVNTVTLSGSGNAVTSASIDGHTLTLTKGSTFSLSGHTHTFASLTSKPTTIAGYGITDAYTKAQVDSTVAKYLPLAGGTITGTLTVNGIATFKSKVAIGDIYIINDGSGNLYVQKTDGKTAANFYATGGITAFGASSVSGGTGGGLNGSVLGFEKATAMTSANNGDSTKTEVSFLASAWSIKQLNDKIAAFGTGVFSDYLTIAAAKATYQPKGSYLTSHQTIYGLTIQKNGTSLGTYTPNSAAKTINVTVPTKLSELSNDSGYTKNTGTVTSVAISVPTGLSVSGSPITTHGTIAIALASGYSIPTTAKQTAWDGAVSAKHTHSNKSVLDGISSTKVSHWNSAYDWYALMTTDEETADGIINKWNEVVSFLANIAQTDTLSGIVDGINKSISDEVARAKKAEGVNASGISANKGSIATLQGYFTNGSAKKALQLTNARKLWGNSFNGTADINGSIIVPSGKYISIGNIKLEYDAANKALKITNTTTEEVANLYTSGGVSAYGVGASSSSGGGLNGSVKAYADAIRLTTENLSEIASAYSVAKLYSEIQNVASAVPSISVSVPTGGNALTGATYDASTGVITFAKGTFLTAHQSLDGYVNAIAVSGSGNAVTAVTKSGKTITFTKGATYLTSHQSLSNYYTKSSVDSLLSGKSATSHTHSVKINGVTKTIAATGGTAVDLGTYLTSHQSLANYVTINDSRLSDSRYPKFANGTWYLVGDDAYIGDHNIGGTFCIKSANNDSVAGIALYNTTESKYARLWFDNKNINLDHQLVMNNNRIWIQGVGTAGGNYNRLTLVAGMPSGLAYNTSCRGTILYSNGIAFADPYNGNSNNDSGWIRHLETSANGGTLEIAVGDDNSNEEIHFRWYDTTSTSEHIGNDITVPRATGTLALTSQIPTTLPANGGNSDTVDGYHASGLLTALSNSDKGISITVGGTTKSVSNISVNYASSAGNADTVDGYHATDGRTFNGNIHWGSWEDTWSDGTNTHPWYGFDHRHENTGPYSTTITDFFGMTIKTANTLRLDYGRLLLLNGTSIYDINVASATKLAAARKIWGQSFDGTDDITGVMTINPSTVSVGTDNTFMFKVYSSTGYKNGLAISSTDNVTRLYAKPFGDGMINSLEIHTYNSADVNAVTISNTGNVGIGTTSPAYKLHVSGEIYTTTKVNINGIILEKDSNGDLKVNGNLYATGGISAYGTSSAGSGGGLSGSVKSYADALKLASESLSEIASAYSIKQLSTRITSLEGGSATSISVSGGGNAVTSVTKNGTTISVVKGSTFLTSHQSLSAYLKTENANNTFLKLSGGTISNDLIVNGSIKTTKLYLPSIGDGYIVSGVKDTNGSDFASVNCILKNWNSLGISSYDDIIRIVFNSRAGDIYLRGKLSAASLSGNLSWSYITDRPSSYTPSAHTHKWTEITDRITKVSQLANDAGYLTSHQSLAGYATQSWVNSKGYITSSGSCAYSTSAGNADTVDGYHATDGRTFNGNIHWGSWEDTWSDGTNTHPWYGFDHRHENTGPYSTTITDFFGMTIKTANTLRLDYGRLLLLNGTSIYDINVASASKLQTPRTLWGQSFNGTANISGSMTGVGDMTLDAGARIKHGSGNLYIGNSDNSNWIGVQDICSQSSIGDGNWSLRTSGAAHFKDTTINGTATIKDLLSLVDGSHKGLKMGSTYISSLDGEVILQGNTALRFGNDAWDYNQWAGLKYDHSIKTVYLGIADGSIFKANSAQSGGVINLKQGISSVYTPTLYAGGDIYHTGAYRMLWKNSKASKYLNVMNISQDDNGILTIGYGNFSNNKNVVLEGYNLNFRVGNDSGMKSMWLNYNNGNPVLSLDGNFYATGGVTAYKSSDERLKHDIHGVDSLAIIKAMGGTVAFRYNADNKDSIGWIAQRVLHNTFMQDLVEKDDKGFLKINYWSPKLIAVAFGAIEQVDDEVSRLKRRVRDLENEVEQLKSDRL